MDRFHANVLPINFPLEAGTRATGRELIDDQFAIAGIKNLKTGDGNFAPVARPQVDRAGVHEDGPRAEPMIPAIVQAEGQGARHDGGE
jgi:hypothetical protein